MALLKGKKRTTLVVLLALAGALLGGTARPMASFVVPASLLQSSDRLGRASSDRIGRSCTLRHGLRMSGDAPKFEKKCNKVTAGTPSSRLLDFASCTASQDIGGLWAP